MKNLVKFLKNESDILIGFIALAAWFTGFICFVVL